MFYQLRGLIFLCFLFPFNSNALVIKIEKDDSGYFKENLFGLSHNGIIKKRVYRLNINGNYINALAVGEQQVDHQDDTLQIEFSGGITISSHANEIIYS